MADETLIKQALAMLKSDAEYRDDARQFARIANSVVGSVLAITTHRPRQYCEQAVCEALRRPR